MIGRKRMLNWCFIIVTLFSMLLISCDGIDTSDLDSGDGCLVSIAIVDYEKDSRTIFAETADKETLYFTLRGAMEGSEKLDTIKTTKGNLVDHMLYKNPLEADRKSVV